MELHFYFTFYSIRSIQQIGSFVWTCSKWEEQITPLFVALAYVWQKGNISNTQHLCVPALTLALSVLAKILQAYVCDISANMEASKVSRCLALLVFAAFLEVEQPGFACFTPLHFALHMLDKGSSENNQPLPHNRTSAFIEQGFMPR